MILSMSQKSSKLSQIEKCPYCKNVLIPVNKKTKRCSNTNCFYVIQCNIKGKNKKGHSFFSLDFFQKLSQSSFKHNLQIIKEKIIEPDERLKAKTKLNNMIDILLQKHNKKEFYELRNSQEIISNDLINQINNADNEDLKFLEVIIEESLKGDQFDEDLAFNKLHEED